MGLDGSGRNGQASMARLGKDGRGRFGEARIRLGGDRRGPAGKARRGVDACGLDSYGKAGKAWNVSDRLQGYPEWQANDRRRRGTNRPPPLRPMDSARG